MIGLLWNAKNDACNCNAWFVVPVEYIHLGWADENNKYKHDNKNTICNQSIINKAPKLSQSTRQTPLLLHIYKLSAQLHNANKYHTCKKHTNKHTNKQSLTTTTTTTKNRLPSDVNGLLLCTKNKVKSVYHGLLIWSRARFILALYRLVHVIQKPITWRNHFGEIFSFSCILELDEQINSCLISMQRQLV